MERIAVIGAGSWGTALASLLCDNGHDVILWSYAPEEARELNEDRTNGDKLPGFRIPDGLSATCDLAAAIEGRDALVLVVPSFAMRQTAEKIAALNSPIPRLICCTKGIEEQTLLSMTGILSAVFPGVPVAALSGPSHAEEVVQKMPTAVVCASKDPACAFYGQRLFMNDTFRVYRTSDLTGVETGAALKNVIALAAGMSDGVGFGDNSKAALITRGAHEITRLAVAMGANPETLAGLAGIGDLIVTCTSRHSRNYNTGYLLGQGLSLEEALKKVHMVAEGVCSAKPAADLGRKYGVELPIIEAVNAVLFDGMLVRDGVLALMSRAPKAETSYL